MTSSKPIVVDEEEPDTGPSSKLSSLNRFLPEQINVEDPTYNSSEVEIQTDKWVPEEFQILNFLGRGKFGEVKRCSEFRTGSEFAAKFICTPRPQDKTDVAHEVYIMKKLRHRRLIQLYSAFEAKCEMCLVLEIVYGGELFERVISEDFTLSEKACTCFVRQICEGVQYIHSQNIIHLDLKPENILCLSRSGNRIKIIDFGLAREYDPKKDTRVLFGTPEFMAPEVVLFDPIHFATDMWSIGVMTYVLLSGLSPFMGDTDTATLSNVTVGKYSLAHREFSKVSENAKDFITNLLITDKRKRYTATMCLEHPWLQKHLQSDIPHLDISKQQLKTYVYRHKWMKAVNALIALKRIGVPLKSLRTMTQSSTLDHRNPSNTSESADVRNNYCSKMLEPVSSLKHSVDSYKTFDTQSTHASKVDTRQRFESNVDAATPKKQPKTPKSSKTVDQKITNGVDATKFGELNNTSRGLAWSKENNGCESLAGSGSRWNNVLKKTDAKQTNHRHGTASNFSRLRNIFSNNRT